MRSLAPEDLIAATPAPGITRTELQPVRAILFHRNASLVLAALLTALLLAGCGKKGPPEPPGPPSQVIWPRSYPTY